MKNIVILILAFILTFCMSACTFQTGSETPVIQVAENGEEFSVSCADSDPTCITYCEAMVRAGTGHLVFTNDNSFAIEIVLTAQDSSGNSLVQSISAGESFEWQETKQKTCYVIGIRASVEEGTEIHLKVQEK